LRAAFDTHAAAKASPAADISRCARAGWQKIFAAIRLKGHLQGYSTLKKDRLQASDDRQTAQPAPDIWSQAQRPMSRPDGIDGAAQGPVFRKFPWQNSGLGGVGVTLFSTRLRCDNFLTPAILLGDSLPALWGAPSLDGGFLFVEA